MTRDPSTGGAAVAPLTLVTEDGFPIAGTRYKALGAATSVVLVAPATGVPQRFYASFARRLAEAGHDVLTWDWRGVAESRHGVPTCDPRLSMSAWGQGDLVAAIDWADRRAGARPVMLVGHSFGGQAAGLARNASRLDALVLVAAQHGWCGHWPWPRRAGLELFWRIGVPAMVALWGRLPSSRIGLGEDLPAGVASEWARWCRRRDYLGDWSGHGRLEAPILAWSFSGDPIAPRRAVEALLAQYSAAPALEHRHVEESDLGHFGFFRHNAAPRLWDDTLTFLDRVSRAAAPAPAAPGHA